MKRVKKTYRYRTVLIEVCDRCGGTGMVPGFVYLKCCPSCDGQRGEWERVRELVGEEVVTE